MTQDEIIEMTRQAGGFDATPKFLKDFAKLVAAKEQKKWEDQTAVEIHEAVLEEREACANVCESTKPTVHNSYECNGYECAELIRARGEAT